MGEKVDVIDFIINVLREHEKTLDELIGRLEAIVQERRRREDRDCASEFRRQADIFRGLSKIAGSGAETEEQRAMAKVAEGMASVCEGLSDYVEKRGEAGA